MELDPEAQAELEKKQAADALKARGTEAYKSRDFATALSLYKQAWDTYPKDVAYLGNQSAVHFETGDFEECIRVCLQAADLSTEIRTDYALLARILARAGNAALKLDRLEDAIEYFKRAQTNSRNRQVAIQIQETTKKLEKRRAEAYLSPEISDQERERGNALFKDSKFKESVDAYSEAIKRNPKDPRNWSNRAASFIKLMAPNEALRDCEEALKLDPTFMRAHQRKVNALMMMKKEADALTAISEAMQADTSGASHPQFMQLRMQALTEINRQSQADPEAVKQRIANDPEIQGILNDPTMQLILQQASTDPAALHEHMKNPTVANKINKLIAAGVIRTG
ncbi:hypothetical protein H696_04609 [Fonticula alba]|uniref:STI1 domain-containing protein n=1 Tax=Fonticula alba TaxID=691883 RepID=A0A058Z4I3_FONAL|nr:hypothetical protein H696_04609 [Fonticula alba]KCV69199.1 hypothetical protein H696_04609 [Fonticula alba]|eukprot:XP_009496770.1 hypothetical protein H696_04609 [Fonticula alba]